MPRSASLMRGQPGPPANPPPPWALRLVAEVAERRDTTSSTNKGICMRFNPFKPIQGNSGQFGAIHGLDGKPGCVPVPASLRLRGANGAIKPLSFP